MDERALAAQRFLGSTILAASDRPKLGLFSVISLKKVGPYCPANAAIETCAMTADDVAEIVSDCRNVAVLTEPAAIGLDGVDRSRPLSPQQRSSEPV